MDFFIKTVVHYFTKPQKLLKRAIIQGYKLHLWKSVDIWALGIVVYNMLHNGEHPFYENSDTR
jgi:hypothetical protein